MLYNNYNSYTWIDYQTWKPKEFLLRYAIQIDENEIYNDQIEVKLDSSYLFIPPTKGFEKRTKKNHILKVNKQMCIQKAKQLGLVENDSTKAFTHMF